MAKTAEGLITGGMSKPEAIEEAINRHRGEN
jgi:hypothetical protein